MDIISKAKKRTICYKCKRTIYPGDYVGYIAETYQNQVVDMIPFCLEEDCSERR